jgi:ABC-type Fe3+ transport system permease subunit
MLYHYLLLKSYITQPLFGAKLSEVQDVCNAGGFFSFPRWYKYLEIKTPTINDEVVCSPELTKATDVWLIILAVIEILLRVAMIVAIVFVIVGGVKFVTSRGNPDKINQARNTVQDALIGLIIAISASAVVGFIAGRFAEG